MDINQAKISAEELSAAKAYFDNRIVDGTPFSFTVNGKKVCPCSGNITKEFTDEKDKTLFTKHYYFEGFDIKQEAILYKNYPFVDWTLYVTCDEANEKKISFTGLTDTFAGKNITVHHQKGSLCHNDDFQPYDTVLETGKPLKLVPTGARSSQAVFPYFCIETDNCGVNLAVGWPTEWRTVFTKTDDGVEIDCAQDRLGVVMTKGETLRSPRILLQFWDKNGLDFEAAEVRCKNIFRRYMRQYNMPRNKDGQVPTRELSACSSHQFKEMIKANTWCQMQFIDGYVEKELGLDNWWMDAGWYPCDGDWYKTGTWDPDLKRFPCGLKPIADHAKARGLGIILWHEPERVYKGSYIYENHKDFLLMPMAENTMNLSYHPDCALFNMGNDEACKWISDKINKSIDDNGVTLYRQDFNTDPMAFFVPNETEDRIGAVENHYASGILRFWDNLREAHPGMLIDECSSGGRRDDIEMMKRSIVFIRSDMLFEPTGQQSQFAWFAQWIPFSGTGMMIGKSAITPEYTISEGVDTYALRSYYSPHMTCAFDIRDESIDWKGVKTILDEWREIVDTYSGDLYPLTKITMGTDIWASWQYNRETEGDGCVQAFRRQDNKESSVTVKLSGLDADASYRFVNFDDRGNEFVMTGAEAMSGMTLTLPEARSSLIIKYTKL